MATVVELGPTTLTYDAGGLIERIGIVDPSAGDQTTGYDTYFTTEPKLDWRSKVKLKQWDEAPEDAKPTKRKPRPKFEEGSGTAQSGLVAFLDYSSYGDELYIHYMNVRTDSRRRGYATALVDWIYAKAAREGKVVNWGRVFYPAELMLDRYRERYPNTRGKRAMTLAYPAHTRTAHLGNDPEAVYHCPFCGSGALVGGPDGSVTCGVCERTYMVFIQPQFSGMPADQSPGAMDPAANSNDGAVEGLNEADPFDPDAPPVTDISQAPPFELVTTPAPPAGPALVAMLAERIDF